MMIKIDRQINTKSMCLFMKELLPFQNFSLFILYLNGLVFRIKDNADHAVLFQQLLQVLSLKENHYLNINSFYIILNRGSTGGSSNK